jgi:multimeric flavodoxin WrbA
MKILGISSGFKNGNNDSMCKEALMGAKEMGADIEFINLHNLDLKYCTGCVTCAVSLFTGKGNRCSLKDDFEWLLDKMLDADGIVFATPIFVKGTPGIMHTLIDRFGPRMDRGNNVIATKISEEKGGKIPDPRILKDKVVSYMGIGGSDWTTRVSCDHGLQAMTPMWKIIDNEVFPWSKGIIMEDEKVARAHEIGVNLAKAAKDIDSAAYQGEPGVCPHCHSRNFYLNDNSSEAVCCLCGIVGEIKVVDGKVVFEFPEEQLEHAHDTLSGKIIHAGDIQKNESTIMELKKTDEFNRRVKNYKDFISASVPE